MTAAWWVVVYGGGRGEREQDICHALNCIHTYIYIYTGRKRERV